MSRHGRPTRVTHLLLAVAVAAGCASALGAPGTASAASSPGLRIIGKFVPTTTNPVFHPTASDHYVDHVNIYVDDSSRVLYTVDRFNPAFVAAYDLDTLRPIGAGTTVGGVVTATAIAPGAGGLVVAAGSDFNQPTSTISVLGVRGGKLTRVASVPVQLGDLKAGTTVVGLTGVPSSSTLYVESATAAAGTQYQAGTVTIGQLTIPKTVGGTGRVVWAESVPDCRLPVRATTDVPAALGFVAAAGSLFFGCAVPGNLGIYQPTATGGSGAGRVALRGAGSLPAFDHFELYPIAGVFEGGFSQFDAGSGRLLVMSNNATLGGATAYVFDAVRQAWVGGIGLGTNAPTTAGMDSVHGRAYMLTNLPRIGMVAADVRPTPVSQGASYPQWYTAPDVDPSKVKALNITPTAPIATDPSTHRLFVGPYSSPDNAVPHHFVFVVRDELGYYRPPSPDDPDANTADLVERPGVTGSTFATSAQGYGAIYRMVGGWRNVTKNVESMDVDQYPVGPGTRELDVALVDKMSLTPGVSSARVITADRDADNTGEDMSKAQASWPFDPAQCSDFGDKSSVVTGTDATASCNAAKQRTTATVDGGSSSVTGSSGAAPVLVHDSNVVATLDRDVTRGAVATVTSTVHGVTLLGGAVKIGQIVATATAVAHGRPGTAKTSYRRDISHVTLNGTTLCTSPCSTDAVAAAVNSRFPGRLRLDFPDPEGVARRGSPGGYLAAILRDPIEQAQEVFLNEQAADRTQVPGLVVTVYGDNVVPSRTVAYLAGTQVESRYGIFPLDDNGSSSVPMPAGGATGGTVGAPGAPGTSAGDLSLPRALAGANIGSSPRVAGPYAGAAGALRHGLQLAMGGLRALGHLLPIWLVLLAPVYLSARRRLLLTRAPVVSGGSR